MRQKVATLAVVGWLIFLAGVFVAHRATAGQAAAPAGEVVDWAKEFINNYNRDPLVILDLCCRFNRAHSPERRAAAVLALIGETNELPEPDSSRLMHAICRCLPAPGDGNEQSWGPGIAEGKFAWSAAIEQHLCEWVNSSRPRAVKEYVASTLIRRNPNYVRLVVSWLFDPDQEIRDRACAWVYRYARDREKILRDYVSEMERRGESNKTVDDAIRNLRLINEGKAPPLPPTPSPSPTVSPTPPPPAATPPLPAPAATPPLPVPAAHWPPWLVPGLAVGLALLSVVLLVVLFRRRRA